MVDEGLDFCWRELDFFTFEEYGNSQKSHIREYCLSAEKYIRKKIFCT